MDATMMHEPLGTAAIFAHGERIHASSRIGLFDGEQMTWRSYAETANRARRLATALRLAGVHKNTRAGMISPISKRILRCRRWVLCSIR